MRMRNIPKIGLIAACLSVILFVGAALALDVPITNPNFITDISGWAFQGCSSTSWRSIGYLDPGSLNAVGASSQVCQVGQSAAITATGIYTLTVAGACPSGRVWDVILDSRRNSCTGNSSWQECIVTSTLTVGSANVEFDSRANCAFDNVRLSGEAQPTPTPTNTPTVTPTPTGTPTPTPQPITITVIIPTPEYSVITGTLPSGKVYMVEYRVTSGEVLIGVLAVVAGLLFIAVRRK